MDVIQCIYGIVGNFERHLSPIDPRYQVIIALTRLPPKGGQSYTSMTAKTSSLTCSRFLVLLGGLQRCVSMTLTGSF